VPYEHIDLRKGQEANILIFRFVMKESETTMAKFRVTQKRADLGILNRSLQNKYNDLVRTSRLVKQLKEMEPERYVKILKDRLEKAQHVS